jgi:hypothetical protein
MDQIPQSYAGEPLSPSVVPQADFNRITASDEANADDVSSLEVALARIEKVQ